MKVLFDLLPFLIFSIGYPLWGIYVATAGAIAASVLQILFQFFTGRKIDKMQWIALGLICVFGGLTLILKNPIFVMWKSSIISWLLAFVLLATMLMMKKNPLQALLGSKITMPDVIWRNMTISWVGYFFAIGLLNLIVAYSFSESIWFMFKTFGGPALLIVFIIVQMVFLGRYISPVENENK